MTRTPRHERSPLVQWLRDHLAALLQAWLVASWLIATYHQHRKHHHGGGRHRRPRRPGRE
ncbi:MAG: hypothetical protein ACOC0M_00235 [Halomonas sp.]